MKLYIFYLLNHLLLNTCFATLYFLTERNEKWLEHGSYKNLIIIIIVFNIGDFLISLFILITSECYKIFKFLFSIGNMILIFIHLYFKIYILGYNVSFLIEEKQNYLFCILSINEIILLIIYYFFINHSDSKKKSKRN